MVNTFLPFPSFVKSAQVLDYRRLGKQRVEAMQLINILTNNTETKGWRTHPALLMWVGYADALKLYCNIIIEEWIKRGYSNTMKLYDVKEPVIYPWWFGMMDFHYSHVASLRRKDPEYYESRLEMPEEYAAKGYCWPTIEDGKQILKFNPISWPTPKKPVSVKKMGKDISPRSTRSKGKKGAKSGEDGEQVSKMNEPVLAKRKRAKKIDFDAINENEEVGEKLEDENVESPNSSAQLTRVAKKVKKEDAPESNNLSLPIKEESKVDPIKPVRKSKRTTQNSQKADIDQMIPNPESVKKSVTKQDPNQPS